MPKRHSIWQFVSQQRFVSIVAGQVVVIAVLALMFLGSSFFTNVGSAFAASCTGSDTGYVQHICMPAKAAVTQQTSAVHENASASAVKGTFNNFPYGQCTWWADQRYHQLTGIYVPWIINSNANVWVTRANQYHWNVSTQPKVGSIMMLAAWVEGAGGYGHVAVVEKLLGGGRFQVSQMNWTGVGIKSYGNFATGRGVYFISFN